MWGGVLISEVTLQIDFIGTLHGYLAHEKLPPPPKDHHKTLGIVLLWGPRKGVFLMSEVPPVCTRWHLWEGFDRMFLRKEVIGTLHVGSCRSASNLQQQPEIIC